jgi:egghead protein (zeste-white 4 protein)
MNTVFSPITNKAYFKKHGKLYEAPFDSESKVIDFTEVGMVDYFFLTTEELEDAFWALVAMQKGIRCRWVNGYLEEQSTQSVSDFIKQRRRWFQGLVIIAR